MSEHQTRRLGCLCAPCLRRAGEQHALHPAVILRASCRTPDTPEQRAFVRHVDADAAPYFARAARS